MEKKERQYVGSGRQVENYDMVNITLCISELPDAEIYEFKGKKYINLTLGKKREIDAFGKSHALWINDFKPDKTKAQEKALDIDPKESKEFIDPDDLPF